jgi:exopolysaccharide/PEP-CTERM locus tyrosine autokinase
MSRIEQALEKAASLRNTISAGTGKRDADGKAVIQPLRQHIPPPPVAVGEVKSYTENPLVATLCDPHSPVSEEYRKLKSSLTAYIRGDNFRNVIMVTSSVSGEGKSLTSLNLAITLAHDLDHTVLLVDADLRKPSIQEYLSIETTRGLSDHLKDGTPLCDLLIKTGIGRLNLLPAGTPMRNPVELFSSQRMKEFVSEIRNRYPDRFIIIDTPPLLPFAEARSLSNIVDGIIFVIREGKTTPENISDALKTIDTKKLVGSVFNAATTASLNGRYHSYYYGYGYSYGGKSPADTEKKKRRKSSQDGQPASDKEKDGSFIKKLFSR